MKNGLCSPKIGFLAVYQKQCVRESDKGREFGRKSQWGQGELMPWVWGRVGGEGGHSL